MSWLRLSLLVCCASLRLAISAASSTSSAQASQSTACGAIVNDQNTNIFNASFVYECLTSVPFNSAVASQFLNYYNDTLQFQSTLTYLKDPPRSYQQPGIDLLGGLAALQQGIEDGIFPNQYEFEAALQTLLYASHDGHVTLNGGILAAFSFSSPEEIVSLSLDGIQPPEVYLVRDLADSNFFLDYRPSPITFINGENVVTYLTQFAAENSIGMIEPHGDWNQLMRSAAQDIQGYSNTFTTATFYPGDSITFELGNGTTLTELFQATYYDLGDTGPLQTGGDFYNSFVLGLLPASYDPDLIDNNTINITAILEQTDPDISGAAPTAAPTAASTSSPAATSAAPISSAPACGSWSNLAYPDCADTFQDDLGTFGGGVVSGYFLNSTSVAVLSIPSFEAQQDEASSFDSAIIDFITTSRKANMKKVVIDLQSNFGGSPLVATDAFKRFFPNINPFEGSRLRAHPAANVMGNTITEYFGLLDNTTELFADLITNEWVATAKINADTNELFTSWSEEFGGPYAFDGDYFTTTQRYDFADTFFDYTSVDDPNQNFTVFGFGSNSAPANAAPAYAAEDIIILTDGICHSACTLFVEMMHHEAGVRIVVAGGLPEPGPMQGASGSRGASIYYTSDMDEDIQFTQEILEDFILDDDSASPYFLPNRTTELAVQVTYASINLRDQVRPNETVPLQFIYEAADCRIFYTPSTFYNYTALWQYAADAIWTKPSLCVNGSTGFASPVGGESDLNGPFPSSSAGTITADDIIGHLNTSNASTTPFLTHDASSIEDAAPRSKFDTVVKCKSTQDCINIGKTNHVCAVVPLCDINNNPTITTGLCLKKCTNGPQGAPECKATETCLLDQVICTKPGVCARVNSTPLAHALVPNSQGTIPHGVCDLVCNGQTGLRALKKSGPS